MTLDADERARIDDTRNTIMRLSNRLVSMGDEGEWIARMLDQDLRKWQAGEKEHGRFDPENDIDEQTGSPRAFLEQILEARGELSDVRNYLLMQERKIERLCMRLVEIFGEFGITESPAFDKTGGTE